MCPLPPKKPVGLPSRHKVTNWHTIRRSVSTLVKPVAVETLGAWGPDSLKFVKEIGKRIADNCGDQRSTSFLLQAISMAIQRGNVTSIRGSVPNTKNLHEIFYL